MGELGEHWRDVKRERRKRKRQGPSRESPPPKRQQHRRCWDWMAVSGSCHYARNRSSFKEYRRVGRTVANAVISGEYFVAGVGTVELKVRSSPEEGSPERTLVLEDVLHIPDAICNGFCYARYHTIYGGSTSFRNMESRDAEGRPLWYAENFRGLNRVVLDGNPQGETYLTNDPKWLSLHVSDDDLENILS